MDADVRTAWVLDSPARRLLVAGLAPLCVFVWQYVITRTLLDNPSGSMSFYYYGRGALALVVALVALKVPDTLRRCGGFLSTMFALVAGVSPFVLELFPRCAPSACITCLLAGAASSWLYLQVFRMYACQPLHCALNQLLGSLAVSHIVRVGLGFVPVGILPAIGLVLPMVCVVIARRVVASLADNGVPHVETTPVHLRDLPGVWWLSVAEFAVFGCVAGVVRTPYETQQFSILVNTVGMLLIALGTVLFLWWARHVGGNVHLAHVCQMALLLLLTVLLALVLYGDADSVVAAVASLFARLGVYTLLLYVFCVFVSRREAHPYVVFGFGWGFFTLATGLGMMAADVVGISQFSSAVALGVVYVLVVVSYIAGLKTKGDDLLFAPSCDEDARVVLDTDTGEQTLGGIMERCHSIGEEHGLTRREIEVMQLICLGRSKSYIAGHFSISENTVRGYAKNVYRKLGIHSRQDLLTIVGIA